MSKPNPSRRLVIIALAIVAVSLIFIAFREGKNDGAASIERIELLWPEFMSMPEQDRALLGGLALTCRLERRAATPGDVENCLLEGAESSSPILPSGMSKEQASVELKRLLSMAKARD